MPAQTKSGGLMAKYGSQLDQAVRKHAGDKTTSSNPRLPPGIKNGVARLTTAEFAQYGNNTQMAGDYYFRVAGVVVEPTEMEVDGRLMRVAGLQISQITPCCPSKDGRRSMDDAVDNVLKMMRTLGADTDGCGGEDLESLAETLREASPYFWFRTSVKPAVKNTDGSIKYEEGVWENIDGVTGLEDYVPPDEEAVEDNTPPVRPTSPTKSVAGKPAPRPTPEPEPEPEPEEEPADAEEAEGEPTDGPSYGEMSLDDLVGLTSSADETESGEAANELSRRATEAGCGAEADAAGSWDEVKGLIEAAQAKKKAGGKKAGGKPAAVVVPAPPPVTVGDVFHYSPLDPKTKKPFVDPKTKKPRRPVEVEVVSVDDRKGTADVKNLDDETVYEAVPVADLKPPF